MLYRETPAPKWAISLFGIHLFPTVQVFLGCLALVPALAYGGDGLGLLDAIALVVTGGAILLETVADAQMRAFARTKQPGDIMTDGLWAWCRHPNYLGELGFWWGLWLFAIAAADGWWWTVIGPLAMTAMFQWASIPMLDRRSTERRPGYA
jgi:steroid 5-alpha reductase family enzyme